MTRDAALAASPRIAIDTPSVRGSIALKGSRIDDLVLVRHRETTDRNSPAIVLLSPFGSPRPYYAEFGWVGAAGSNVKLPGPDTEWRQEGSSPLDVGNPVTIVYDNNAGLTFRRTISVDDKYLFTVKDEVKNTGTAPVTLHPYALIARHGTPQTLGIYLVHEGLIGVLGDTGLQEVSYESIDETKRQTFDVANAWLGFTDRYWATALLPNPDAHLRATFSAVNGTAKGYHADYLLDAQSIPPGGSGSTDARLFAGAKEVAAVDGYNAGLRLNQFDLLIDWGWFSFIVKPMFLAIDFFFGIVRNYGIAILFVVILVQLLFFPLAHKSYAAVAKRKAARPLGKNKQGQPIARRLYVVIQILVQFSLYKMLFITVEMRHAPFFGWIDDLSVPDPTNIFALFGLIPFDPTTLPVLGPLLQLGMWPAIMCVTMWVLIKLHQAPADPTQKVIFNWMPIVVGFWVANFAAGLVIYRAWNSSLSLLHQGVLIHRYGAKIRLLDGLKRTFAKPKPAKPLADSLLTRSSRPSMNVPTSIRIARQVRRASRVTFWLSAVLLLISTGNVLTGVLAVTVVLSVVIYLVALRVGQTLAGREFAAALARDSGDNRPIVLFLRSFDIAQSSLGARFRVELGYVARAFVSIGVASLVGDTVAFVDRRYDVEEHLDNAIGLNAMFVAIGDRLASYGAAKITVKEQDWQETFHRLASASQLIFMMPGPSASLLWELSQIMRSPGLLEKAVFIMPREGKRSLVEAWKKVSDMAAELGVSLPPYSSEGCYFRLRDDGHPSETVALEPFTRALRKFMASPAYTGAIDLTEVMNRV